MEVKNISDLVLYKRAYRGQRKSAKQRGIPFLLSFEEWCEIWIASGKFGKRGCKRDQYVMARYEDKGPYAKGNVKIVTSSENAREGWLGFKHSDATKRRISKGLLGNKNGRGGKGRISPFKGCKHSVEAKNLMRRSMLGNRNSFGSKNGSAKLREEDIPRIRELYDSGLSQGEIGRRFGVSQVMIGCIVRGERWSHV